MEVKVFLDLDDTLADTSKEIENQFQYKNYGINTPILQKNIRLIKDLWIWNRIKNNPQFWESLPKREMAHEIYEEALKIAKTCENIYILTALPKLIFKKDTLDNQKALLLKLLDLNQLYVNLSSLHDPEFECTEEEKKVKIGRAHV